MQLVAWVRAAVIAALCVTFTACGGGGAGEPATFPQSPTLSAPAAPEAATETPVTSVPAAPQPAASNPDAPAVVAPETPAPQPPAPVPDVTPTITILSTGTATFPTGHKVAASNSAFYYLGVGVAPWAPHPEYYAGDPLTANLKVSFVTNAAMLYLSVVDYNTQFVIFVDGKPAQEGLIKFGITGYAKLVQLTFPTGKRERKIELYGRLLQFGGAWVDAGDTVKRATQDDARPLMAFEPGDSYTQGGIAPTPDQNYAALVADTLGYEFWSEAVGGTGWLSAGTNLPETRVQGFVNRLNKAPSVIVTALGYNDMGGDMVLAAQRYDAAIAQAQAKYPTARIATLGPWTPVGMTPALQRVKDMLQARATANGAIFVDVEGIITADNAALYIGIDGVHPTPEGHRYLGQQIALRMRALGF